MGEGGRGRGADLELGGGGNGFLILNVLFKQFSFCSVLLLIVKIFLRMRSMHFVFFLTRELDRPGSRIDQGVGYNQGLDRTRE